jgi:SAM-dependent methyltransferase
MKEINWHHSTYENVENVSNFNDINEIEKYKYAILEKNISQHNFIKEIIKHKPARVLELCCGNGRLEIDLSVSGLLKEHSLGVDISDSRINFAKRWMSEIKGVSADFICDDVFNMNIEKIGKFDLICCLTGSFGYFDAIKENGALKLLQMVRNVLSENGIFVLEIYNHPEYIKSYNAGQKKARNWIKLPVEDPYIYIY